MIFILLMLLISAHCCAMDNAMSDRAAAAIAAAEFELDISHLADNIQEKLISAPIELSLNNDIVYLADENERKDLKKIYGQDFPLNTIFIKAHWLLPRKKTGLETGEFIPAYIPYDYIKDAKEDDTIILTLGGQKYDVLCKQHRRRNFCCELSFQELLKNRLRQFVARANCFVTDEQHLTDCAVIDKSNPNGHGILAYPHLEQLKASLK